MRKIRYRGIEKIRGVQSHFCRITFQQSLGPKQGFRRPTIWEKLEARGYVLKPHSLNVPQCNEQKPAGEMGGWQQVFILIATLVEGKWWRDGLTYTCFYTNTLCLVLFDKFTDEEEENEVKRKNENDECPVSLRGVLTNPWDLSKLVQVGLVRFGANLCRKIAFQEQDWTPLDEMQEGQLSKQRKILIDGLTASWPPEIEEKITVFSRAQTTRLMSILFVILLSPLYSFQCNTNHKERPQAKPCLP